MVEPPWSTKIHIIALVSPPIIKKWNVTMPNVEMHMLITLDSNNVSKRSLDMSLKCFVTPNPWKYNERFKRVSTKES
jgi:hypothetical protein